MHSRERGRDYELRTLGKTQEEWEETQEKSHKRLLKHNPAVSRAGYPEPATNYQHRGFDKTRAFRFSVRSHVI